MRFPKTFAAAMVVSCLAVSPAQYACAQATETDQSTAKPAEKTESLAPELPGIPDKFDHATVSAYIEQLNRIRPKAQSKESLAALVSALSGRIDELLEQKLEDDSAREAIGFRFALFGISSQLGIPDAADARRAWVTALKSDARPVYGQMGRGLDVLESTQTPEAATGQREAWTKIFAAAEALLKETNASPFAANITMQVSELSEMAAPADLASKANEAFAARFAESDSDPVRAAAPVLAGVGRKLGLPGNKMIVEGTTVAGQPFNLTQLEGKVVLVDFWASWCGVCIESFPALEKLYKEHHDAGFEIVGVNIDDTKELWTEFLDKRPLPWLHMQNLGTGEQDRHPNADRYGVNAIPFMVLIGRDGNVIQTNVVPEELETLLPTALAKKAE